jgi:hypothetical protein
MLQSIPQQLLVDTPQAPLKQHRASNTQPSHDEHQDESHQVSWLIRGDEEIRSHDITCLAQDVVYGDGGSLLLRTLGECARNPGLDKWVGPEQADHVDVRDDVAGNAVLGGHADNVADHGASHRDGEMPGKWLAILPTKGISNHVSTYHPRSCILSELHAIDTATIAAQKYGGKVMTNVMTREYPKPRTIAG